jgi:raffinose/stachyose/melibiose transport system substrate-binding protein
MRWASRGASKGSRLAVALMAAALIAVASGSASRAAHQGNVITLTIGADTITNVTTNTFAKYRNQSVVDFNKKYAGRIQIKILPNLAAPPDQTLSRMALRRSLPDIFLTSGAVLRKLSGVGGRGTIMDLAPHLRRDKKWMSSFHPGIFDHFRGSRGGILAVPEERDVIGVFWNKELFRKAGISTFPTTWSAFEQALARLKATGVIPVAMDGDWSTLLWWANYIGTQPGGADLLEAGLTPAAFSKAPVVRATEWVKRLHTSGYVNQDAFTGNFANAETPFLTDQAAILANGPWEVPYGIKGPNASTDLYSRVDYAPSPGSGIIVVPGQGWAIAAKTPAKRAAALLYLRFITTRAQVWKRLLITASFPMIKMKFTAAQKAKLEPLTLRLVEKSTTLKHVYPAYFQATPAGFNTVWKNYWPAYVQGQLTTRDFLARLADAVKQGS